MNFCRTKIFIPQGAVAASNRQWQVDSEGLVVWPLELRQCHSEGSISAPEQDLCVTSSSQFNSPLWPILSPSVFHKCWSQGHFSITFLHRVCFVGNLRHCRLFDMVVNLKNLMHASSNPLKIVTPQLSVKSIVTVYISITMKYCSLLSQRASFDYHSFLT